MLSFQFWVFYVYTIEDSDAETLRVHLLENYGIGLISLGEKNLRIAFSCVEENDIPELFDTILQGVNDLQ